MAVAAHSLEPAFSNISLARISNRLTPRQTLGYHALLLDREQGHGRSRSLMVAGGGSSNNTGPGLYVTAAEERYMAAVASLNKKHRIILDWVLRHSGQSSHPDLAAAGAEWSGYTCQRSASAAAVAWLQSLGEALAESYKIKAL